MKSFFSILLISIMVSISCSEHYRSKNSSQRLQNNEVQASEAKEILTTVCQSCHHPSAAPNDRFAPPLQVAKLNYLALSNDKAEFVELWSDFILAPSPEKAKLHSDVDEFGMMDPLGYSEDQIRSIAIFVYDNELERPDWLE